MPMVAARQTCRVNSVSPVLHHNADSLLQSCTHPQREAHGERFDKLVKA